MAIPKVQICPTGSGALCWLTFKAQVANMQDGCKQFGDFPALSVSKHQNLHCREDVGVLLKVITAITHNTISLKKQWPSTHKCAIRNVLFQIPKKQIIVVISFEQETFRYLIRYDDTGFLATVPRYQVPRFLCRVRTGVRSLAWCVKFCIHWSKLMRQACSSIRRY